MAGRRGRLLCAGVTRGGPSERADDDDDGVIMKIDNHKNDNGVFKSTKRKETKTSSSALGRFLWVGVGGHWDALFIEAFEEEFENGPAARVFREGGKRTAQEQQARTRRPR